MPTISTLTVDVETKTSKFSTGLKILTGGLTTLAAGAAFAFKQFEDSQKVLNQTDAVLKSTGGAAHVTAKQVSELASALSQKAGIDDEAIQTGENMILTFKNISNQAGKGNDIFNRTTKAVLDMSVAMGQDMKSSAIQVGKALNDPIQGMTALRRVGVEFTDAQVKQIEHLQKTGDLMGAQKIILRELTSEFGGSAAAQKTATGSMAVALNNLAETVGKILAPAFEFLAKWLNVAITFLQENAAPAFRGTVEWFQKMWDRISPVVELFAGPFVNALKSLWQALSPLIDALKKLWDTFGPIVKILAVVAAAFFGLGLLVLGFIAETIAKFILWASKVVDAFASVVNWVKDHLVEPIVGAVDRVLDAIGRLIDKIRGPLIAAWQFILGPIKNVIDTVIGWIRDIIGWIQDLIGWLSHLGSNVGAPKTSSGAPAIAPHGLPPGVPRFQQGGVMPWTGLALLHAGETVTPAGAVGGINITINGDVTGEEIIRKVEQGLTNKLNRSGILFNGSVTR